MGAGGGVGNLMVNVEVNISKIQEEEVWLVTDYSSLQILWVAGTEVECPLLTNEEAAFSAY